jgi:hypothetical protein
MHSILINSNSVLNFTTVFHYDSDVPGPAWAQSPGLGLLKLKPSPELRAGPGLGLVGLKPGLLSQRSNPRGTSGNVILKYR